MRLRMAYASIIRLRRYTMRTLLLLPICLPILLSAQGNANDHYLNAQAAYGAGDWRGAHSLTDSAIAADPSFAKAWKLRGDSKQQLKEHKASLEDYSEAIKLDKTDARAYVSRSAARITTGNLKGALTDLDKAIELTPDDADILYNRACAKYMGGDNNGALRDAQRALKLNAALADALFLSGVIKGEEQRTEEGMLEVEAALKMKANIPGSWSTFLHEPLPTDADQDSLVCDLIVPNGNACSTIAGYTYPADLVPGSTFNWVDPATGAFQWYYPVVEGAYQIAIRCTEYRNGSIIGQTTRNMTICVSMLPNAVVESYTDGSAPLLLYPNPAQNLLHLNNPTQAQATITDPTGRQVLTTTIPANGTLPVGTLASGCYILHLRTAQQRMLAVTRFTKE